MFFSFLLLSAVLFLGILVNINLVEEIELEDENVLFPEKIHLGYAAKDGIRILLAAKQIDEVLVKEFRLQLMSFVVQILTKLFVRNPLGFVVLRNAICLNPRVTAKESREVLGAKTKKLIMELVLLKTVQSQNSDTAMTQYSSFLSNKAVNCKEKLLSFDRTTD